MPLVVGEIEVLANPGGQGTSTILCGRRTGSQRTGFCVLPIRSLFGWGAAFALGSAFTLESDGGERRQGNRRRPALIVHGEFFDRDAAKISLIATPINGRIAV